MTMCLIDLTQLNAHKRKTNFSGSNMPKDKQWYREVEYQHDASLHVDILIYCAS